VECHKDEGERNRRWERVSEADGQMKHEESRAARNKGTEKQNIVFVLHIFVLSFVITSTEIYKIMKGSRRIKSIQ